MRKRMREMTQNDYDGGLSSLDEGEEEGDEPTFVLLVYA